MLQVHAHLASLAASRPHVFRSFHRVCANSWHWLRKNLPHWATTFSGLEGRRAVTRAVTDQRTVVDKNAQLM